MRKTTRGGLIAAGALICAMAGPTAWADDASTTSSDASASEPIIPGDIERHNNISVQERPHPEYDAIGIQLGALAAAPTLTISDTYNDNILAAATHPVGDSVLDIDGQLAVHSDWTHGVMELNLHASRHDYRGHADQSTSDYGFSLQGSLSLLTQASVFAAISGQRSTEPRTDPSAPRAAATPSQYDQSNLTLGGQWQLASVRLVAQGGYERYRYDNVLAFNGLVIRQDDRNRGTASANLRADFDVSPNTSLYFDTAFNQVAYQITTSPDRNSHGYVISAGTSFDLTALLRGHLQFGYLNQTYNSRVFGSTSGLSSNVLIDWFASELTTVNLNASRSVQEAVSELQFGGSIPSGYLENQVGLRVDHEFFPNVIVSAQGSLEQDDYQNADRTDDRVGESVSIGYLMNRGIGFKLAYSRFDLNSKGSDRAQNYTSNQIMLYLTLRR